jgi:endonuclease/exonuclease/phosphatase family metal-dependent hydrolase
MVKRNNKKRKSSFLIHLFLYINLIFVLALLLAYAAEYITPAKFWLPVLFGLAYPYLALVNVIFIVFWIMARRIYFLVPLIALLIGWRDMKATVAVHKHQTADSSLLSLKLLSYNLNNLSNSSHRFDIKLMQQVTGYLNRESAGIITLQEFYSNVRDIDDQLQSLSEKLSLPHYHFDFYTPSENGNHTYALILFSKYPIVSSGTLRGANTKAYAIYCDVVTNRTDTIRIYDIHLESIHFKSDDYAFINDRQHYPGDHTNFRERVRRILWKIKKASQMRAEQAEKLRSHVDRCPYPVIISGDFNDVPTSYIYHKLARQFTDAFTEAGYGFGYTFTGLLLVPLQIDHILLSKNFRAYDMNIPKVKFSDHYPVTTWIHARETAVMNKGRP